MVVDTKYKRYGEKKVSNGDIYQLLFYAQFVRAEDPCSVMIFPQYEGEEAIWEVIDLLPDTVKGCLFIKSVHVEGVIDALKRRDELSLSNLAEWLINSEK